MGKSQDIDNKQVEAQMSDDSDSVPPPPYSSSGARQVFQVHYGDWRSDIWIVDNSGSEVFSGHRKKYSTKVEIQDRNKNVVGNSKASSITTKISVEIHNPAPSSFELHNHATFGSPKYNSPAFGGQQMTWKNKMWSTKVLYDLMDDSGKVYAHFQSSPRTQIGKLELTDDCAGEDRLTEVMVCLLSLLVRKLRNMNDVPQYGIVN